MAGYSVHVDTHGLPERFDHAERELRSALGKAVAKTGTQGRTRARAKAPVGAGTGDASHVPGAGRQAITKKSTRAGSVARCIIFIAGGRKGKAFYMYFQDQGTGPRSTRGSSRRRSHPTGSLEPQYFMERTAIELREILPVVMDLEVKAALVKAGLK